MAFFVFLAGKVLGRLFLSGLTVVLFVVYSGHCCISVDMTQPRRETTPWRVMSAKDWTDCARKQTFVVAAYFSDAQSDGVGRAMHLSKRK